jgi:hypothetical protein
MKAIQVESFGNAKLRVIGGNYNFSRQAVRIWQPHASEARIMLQHACLYPAC